MNPFLGFHECREFERGAINVDRYRTLCYIHSCGSRTRMAQRGNLDQNKCTC